MSYESYESHLFIIYLYICISQDTIDGVEYNVISCVIDDYIIGVYPNSDSKFKELQEKIEDLESTISDLEDRIERLER